MQKWKSLDRIDHDVESGLNSLKERGITCLRGILDAEIFDILVDKTNTKLENPSIFGSQGYKQKDRHKKMLEAFLLGEEAHQTLLNEKILDIVEGYLGGEVLVQEFFVKNDLGDNEVYFPYHAHTDSYRLKNHKTGPFSVGVIVYAHDTEDGAFCYSPGTQHWDASHGADPLAYPEDLQKEIFDNMRRVVGKKGDIVIFDHRGFHGPEQPVPTARTVFLGGFQHADDHGHKTKCPVAVWTTDLRILNDRQRNVLGINSQGPIIPADKLHYDTFKNDNPTAYKLANFAIDTCFKAQKLKDTIRKIVKR